uniref:Uncharacterized protein n=1 Tax=Arundo donax TaxID=35708 RepID=A0A0A8Y5E0_ARUDO
MCKCSVLELSENLNLELSAANLWNKQSSFYRIKFSTYLPMMNINESEEYKVWT